MDIKEVIEHLESWAPKVYQESYDNSGLIVGDKNQSITGILVCLDSTEDVVDEAIKKNCNLIVAHHPIVFSGLKTFTGKDYIERTVIKAIKNDIAIYAIHTNLDNVSSGVNRKIGEKLGLKNLQILASKTTLLKKLITFVPNEHLENVRESLFSSGAGEIGDYDQCSFTSEGKGTFRGNENTSPFVGSKEERHTEAETKLEVILTKNILPAVINSLLKAHPYEEVAYDVLSLENKHQNIGSGMVGELPEELSEKDFLNFVKKTMKSGVVRHTNLLEKSVKRVAFCGGSGSFLLNQAKASGADVFITSDYKYHQFFDADGDILIADIGHFESEQYTIELIADHLMKKSTKFAVHLTETNTNPVNYL